MADKTNANIGFEKQLWDAACVLWGYIPAAEYRKVIIGLIFLRYISAAFDKRYQELLDEGDGFEDDRDAYSITVISGSNIVVDFDEVGKKSWGMNSALETNCLNYYRQQESCKEFWPRYNKRIRCASYNIERLSYRE